MVRLDSVVGVASGAVPTMAVQAAFTLQVADRGGIAAKPSRAKHAGREIVGILHGLLNEARRGFPITRLRKVEVYRLTPGCSASSCRETRKPDV